jgi:tRNA-binding protein
VTGDGEVVRDLAWDEFARVDMRVGRIVEVEDFPQARQPAWKLRVDFGAVLGERRSSAQITNYAREDLVGRLVVAVVNFPPKQIGPWMSECLVTGFHDAQGRVALCVPDQDVPLGAKLL